MGAPLRSEPGEVAAPDRCPDTAALRRQGPDYAGTAVEDVGSFNSERQGAHRQKRRPPCVGRERGGAEGGSGLSILIPAAFTRKGAVPLFSKADPVKRGTAP